MSFDKQAARARCESASPAPWQTRFIFRALVGAQKRADLHPLTKPNMDWPDSDFIAHARTDLPAALDELDAKDKEIERLREALERIAAEVYLAQRLDEDGADEEEQIEQWSKLAIHRQHVAKAALQALDAKGEE